VFFELNVDEGPRWNFALVVVVVVVVVQTSTWHVRVIRAMTHEACRCRVTMYVSYLLFTYIVTQSYNPNELQVGRGFSSINSELPPLCRVRLRFSCRSASLSLQPLYLVSSCVIHLQDEVC